MCGVSRLASRSHLARVVLVGCSHTHTRPLSAHRVDPLPALHPRPYRASYPRGAAPASPAATGRLRQLLASRAPSHTWHLAPDAAWLARPAIQRRDASGFNNFKQSCFEMTLTLADQKHDFRHPGSVTQPRCDVRRRRPSCEVAAQGGLAAASQLLSQDSPRLGALGLACGTGRRICLRDVHTTG